MGDEGRTACTDWPGACQHTPAHDNGKFTPEPAEPDAGEGEGVIGPDGFTRLADLLDTDARLIRMAKAEVLREAADAVQRDMDQGGQRVYAVIPKWLRDRADRIEGTR
jgi:hypothetical protein